VCVFLGGGAQELLNHLTDSYETAYERDATRNLNFCYGKTVR
jgi:hypothetical protein